MLKGGTVSTIKLVCVCSYQCLEVAQPQSLVHGLASMIGGGIHNLHLESWVCVLMSMPGGGIATISILKVVCVCSCQCLVVEEWEDLLGYKRKAYFDYNSNVF